MNLFLAEYDYQVNDFLARFSNVKGEWIALGPSAMHHLSKKGIPYTIPEDYCSRGEIEKLCVAQFDRLTTVCRELDAVLLGRYPFLKEWGIQPFYFHLWQLGQLADGLLSRVLQIKRILDRFSGSKVYAHLGPPKPWAGFGIGFSQIETLWGRLLSLNGWGVDVCTVSEPMNEKGQTLFDERFGSGLSRSKAKWILSNFAGKNPFRWSVASSIRSGWTINAWNILKHTMIKKAAAIGVLNGIYEWDRILPELITDGYPVFFIRGPDLHKRALLSVQPQDDLELKDFLWEDFKKTFNNSQIRYIDILCDRFDYIVSTAPSLAQGIIKGLETFTSKNRITVLLTAVNTDFGSYVTKQFCRIKKIRVLSWQHGAEWYNKRITQRNDLLNLVSCDKMLVYGDGVKFAYESSPLAQEEGCEIIAVGMPSLHPLRDIYPRSDKKEINILWVFGGYYGNGWYCGFSPPFTDRMHYKEQIIILFSLLKCLRNNQRLSLTIKLAPSHYRYDNPPWVEDLPKSKRIRIVYGRPNFVELLTRHDVVIIDSPTTTLLQAVSTKLPVFVLMSVIRWPDEAVDLLRRRASCAENAVRLMEELEQYTRARTYDGDLENDDFLRQYAVHNGKAVSTVMSLMQRILNVNGFNSQ